MNTVRRFLFIFFCLTSLASQAQENTRKLSVGLATWSGYPESVKGFKQAMRNGGYIEGDTVDYLYGVSNGDKDKQREIALQFKEASVDLVYALTTPGTSIVKEILPSDTPIVFSIVTYPADSGLIESFEYSGNNLVGTSNYVPIHHYVNLLASILPQTKSVAIFHRKGEPNSKIQAVGMIRALKRKGIKVLDREPTTIEETREMALALVGQADVFMTTTDTLMQGGAELALIEISLASGVPILSSNKKGIEMGSTFGPVADFYTLGLMSGKKAVQILHDNKIPAQLESEYQNPPLSFINRNSIKKLNISLPNKFLNTVKWVE